MRVIETQWRTRRAKHERRQGVLALKSVQAWCDQDALLTSKSTGNGRKRGRTDRRGLQLWG